MYIACVLTRGVDKYEAGPVTVGGMAAAAGVGRPGRGPFCISDPGGLKKALKRGSSSLRSRSPEVEVAVVAARDALAMGLQRSTFSLRRSKGMSAGSDLGVHVGGTALAELVGVTDP